MTQERQISMAFKTPETNDSPLAFGTVRLCPGCGRVEVRLFNGARFMVNTCNLPLILDQLDDLEDRGGPALAKRFLIRIGMPRTELDLTWDGVRCLRGLLEDAQDEVDFNAQLARIFRPPLPEQVN